MAEVARWIAGIGDLPRRTCRRWRWPRLDVEHAKPWIAELTSRLAFTHPV